jgi:hypothetical protein
MAAYFEISYVTQNSFLVSMTLSNPFGKDHYLQAGISLSAVPTDNSEPDDILTSITPTITIDSGTFSFGYKFNREFVQGGSYKIYAFAQTLDGRYWSVGDYVIVTIPENDISIPATPNTPSYKMFDSYSSLNLTISWNYSSSIKRIWVLLFKDEELISEDLFLYTADGETSAFAELSFCSDYELEIYTSYYTEGDESWSPPKVVQIYTPPSKRIYDEGGTVSISRVNYNNQICATIDADLILSYGLNFQKIIVKAYQCSSDSGSDIVYPGDGDKTIYYSKLADGIYSFEIVADYNGSIPVDEEGNEVTYTQSITIKAPPAFNWTETELNALRTKGAVKTITYSRWNDLMTYISRILRYKGMYDTPIGGNNYGITEKTKIINVPTNYASIKSSDKTLTAKKFNIANYCINQIADTDIDDRVGITDVENGTADEADSVLGKDFITFVECLN